MLKFNKVFGVALFVAVLYFVGQTLLLTVPVWGTGQLQRAIYLLFVIIYLPALPVRLLVPQASPEVSLAVACFAWGALFYLGDVLRRHFGARLTRA